MLLLVALDQGSGATASAGALGLGRSTHFALLCRPRWVQVRTSTAAPGSQTGRNTSLRPVRSGGADSNIPWASRSTPATAAAVAAAGDGKLPRFLLALMLVILAEAAPPAQAPPARLLLLSEGTGLLWC